MTAADDLISLQHTPIDVAASTAFVNHPHAGAVATFIGSTRADSDAQGKPVIALDYEAYDEMATKQLHALARQARSRWPILRLAILHRTGRVAVGEPSVLIAVATGHRAEAFEACRWIIDTLKGEVAIWKGGDSEKGLRDKGTKGQRESTIGK